MKLEIFPDVEQGTEEWFGLRNGTLTASTIGQLITPSRVSAASNDKSRALIRRLAVERITGRPAEGDFQTRDMLRGVLDEPIARDYYRDHYGPVAEVGFMRVEEHGYLGYSPDGLAGDAGLIEIKSRKPADQLATIMAGEPPAYHMAQLQTGLFVSGREWIDYVSFCAGMPLAVFRVEPLAKWFDAISIAWETCETSIEGIISRFNTASKEFVTTEYVDHFAEEEIF